MQVQFDELSKKVASKKKPKPIKEEGSAKNPVPLLLLPEDEEESPSKKRKRD